MLSRFKSSSLASSISITTIAVGIAFNPLTTQQSLAQTQINGAGATSPQALYTSNGGWFNTYGRALPPATNPPGPINSSVQFRYAGVGSGAGRTAFFTKTPPSGTPTIPPPPVSFGGTDVPLTPTEIGTSVPVAGGAGGGLPIQVPSVTFAITLAYNPTSLPTGIRFSRTTYCGILDGGITNWNNSSIAADNPGKTFPNLALRVVRRSDNSGTTSTLSTHLNTVCQGLTPSSYNWGRGVGSNSTTEPIPSPAASNTVYWPTSFLSARGATGITTTISSTTGAIGYVDNGSRVGAGLPAASLRNQAGNYIAPSSTSTSAAFPNVTPTVTNPRIITVPVPANPSASSAYPIVGLTYLLFYDQYNTASANVASGIRGFCNWIYAANPSSPNADSTATGKGYAPLPSLVKSRANTACQTYVDTAPN